MIKQVTEQDIIRLGKAAGIEFTSAECKPISAHITKQLHSFEALNDIDTDGVEPTFDLQGEGRFMVGRCGE